MSVSNIEQAFASRFGQPPEAVYFAPGRVNLIGEHIDYSGGRVMPAAINRGTWFAVARNGTDRLNIHSAAFPESASFRLVDVGTATARGAWTDYAVGMLQQLTGPGAPLPGVDVLVHADLPQNGGLSSSASFTVGFGFALVDLLGLDIDRVALALKARAVENGFVGVNCGIMDPFAVAMARADQCLVLDCGTLAYELLPLALDGHDLVIVNSMVPRK
ncbi:MAG: galactokinase family protein, partial [Xanthomonadales bacterium]|nr:galactokinase family protein [Xanthomonadales bacterium]